MEPAPRQIDALIGLLRDGKFADAHAAALALTEAFPQHEFGWKVLGLALKLMGRGADAVAPMQKALQLSPQDAEGHANLGLVFQDLGRTEVAAACFGRALEIQPDHAAARRHLDRLLASPAAPERIHPYTSLPPRNFWKTAIGERDASEIEQLWRPKFSFSKQLRIVTAGSCFAQHISRSLKSNGFNWIDAEPAPAEMDEAAQTAGGYGVFSFRTGNIYTARQLRQWLSWAFGSEAQSTDVIEEGGRFYDPFRPTIPQQGFASPEALFAARDISLRTMRGAIASADLFIFTLGLTEAWVNNFDLTYPLCPGTIRGEFSAAIHRVHNFSYDEVLADMQHVFTEVRRHNPGIRFLLTVSPVPLTATAMDEHVLVATTYSKSVLRAVAGKLAGSSDDVDYFPSYEMITAPPFEGRFFDRNKRTVTADGVAFVMSQFLKAIGQGSDSPVAIMTVSAAPLVTEGQDTVCEEIILESWNRQNRKVDAAPKITLIGDSHMGMLADALAALEIPFVGGGVMWATQWHQRQFVASERTLLEPTDEKSRRRWLQLYESGFGGTPTAKVIITNVGMQCNNFIQDFFELRLNALYGDNWPSLLPPSLIDDYIDIARAAQIELVRHFVASGHRVICVSDAPVQPVHEDFCTYFDVAMLTRFRYIGCEAFNAREWVRGEGKSAADVRGVDGMHGSPDYYHRLAPRLIETFAIAVT